MVRVAIELENVGYSTVCFQTLVLFEGLTVQSVRKLFEFDVFIKMRNGVFLNKNII